MKHFVLLIVSWWVIAPLWGIPASTASITSFNPAKATAGTQITIYGSNLQTVTAVTIGGEAATSFVIESDGIITAIAAAGSSGDVKITTATGSSSAAGFEYVASVTPTAVQPTVGNGSASNPYQIATLENLYWLASNTSAWYGSSIQTADIDASATSTWFDGAGWTPIGNISKLFLGNYNGNGFTIYGLYCNYPNTDYIGFIGRTMEGKVKNVTLKNVSITGHYGVGGVFGQIGRNEVTNCVVESGIIKGTDRGCGGLIGDCYDSKVINCSSNATIMGSDFIGGFTGMQSKGAISQCFATGNVISKSVAGGFVGYQTSACSIDNCYSNTVIKTAANAPAGGFVGTQRPNEIYSITNCYAAGSITGTIYNFGFGCNMAQDVTSCFWDKERANQNTGVNSAFTGMLGKTTAEMQTRSTFTDAGWDFVGETTNGTNDYWKQNPNANNGYPYLTWQYYSLPPVISSFTPTAVAKGKSISIVGDEFIGVKEVIIGGVQATDYTVVNAQKITAIVPEGAIEDTIRVTTSVGSVTVKGFSNIEPQKIVGFVAIPAATYGDLPFTVSASGGESGNPVVFTSSDPTIASCSGANGTTITILKAGQCTIYANQAKSDDYSAAPQVEQILKVDKKAITLNVQAESKQAGSSDPTFSYTLSTQLVTGDSFTGALTREVGETVGVYAIKQGTLALSDNYLLSFNANSLEIVDYPEVQIDNIADITATSAKGKATINKTNAVSVSARGFVLYPFTDSDKQIGDVDVIKKEETGSFVAGAYSLTFDNLVPNTEYNVRSFATNSFGTSYGSRFAFTSLAVVPALVNVSESKTAVSFEINSHLNSATTEFAIYDTIGGKFVQADGTLASTAVWQTKSLWNVVSVSGLTLGVKYAFAAKARNSVNTETAFGRAHITELLSEASIASFAPTTAGKGQTVTIEGAYLKNISAVTFGGVNAKSFQVSPDCKKITAVLDSGASGDVAVVGLLNTASKAGFTYFGVNIASGQKEAVCSGTEITYTATAVNASSPKYQWKVNGVDVGTNSNTFTSTTLKDKDSVNCVMSEGTQGETVFPIQACTKAVSGYYDINRSPAYSGLAVSFKKNTAGNYYFNTFKASVIETGSVGALHTFYLTVGVYSQSFGITEYVRDTITTTVINGEVIANLKNTSKYKFSSGVSYVFAVWGGDAQLKILAGQSIPSINSPIIIGDYSSSGSAFGGAADEGDGFQMYLGRTVVGNQYSIISSKLAALVKPQAQIASFAPTSAYSGQTVTIKGSNLDCATGVKFGGTAATSFNVLNDSTITAIIANGANGTVEVLTHDETASKGTFKFIANPTIVSFSPTMAGVNQLVTIVGSAFDKIDTVKFGGVVAKSFTVSSNGDTIKAVVSNGNSGNVEVIASYAKHALAGFTYLGVNIASNKNEAVCPGTAVTYTATTTNAANPKYQWKVNGIKTGTNSKTFTPTNLKDKDSVSCNLTSLGDNRYVVDGLKTVKTYSSNMGFDQASVTRGLGIRFTTGNNPYTIEKIAMKLFNYQVGSYKFKIAITKVNGNLPSSVICVEDEVEVQSPPAYVYTVAEFDASAIPNIASYSLAANTSYCIVLYNSGSSQLGIMAQSPYTGDLNPQEGFVVNNNINIGMVYNYFDYALSFGKPGIVLGTIESQKLVAAVKPQAQIASFAPTTAYTDQTVTIKGSGFNCATNVKFGGTAASSFNVVNDSTITALVATGASGTVEVFTHDETASKSGFVFVKTPQTITFDAFAAKVYGDESFTPTATGGSSKNTITFTSENNAIASIIDGKVQINTAGTVKIWAHQKGNDGFLDADSVSNVLTINPKGITITASANLTKNYGDLDPTLTYTVDGLLATDKVTGELVRQAGDTVGLYDISIGTLDAGKNYAVSYTANVLEITPKPITISVPNDLSKVYGETDGEIPYTPNPSLLNGDTFIGQISRKAGEDVGQYEFTLGTLSAGKNYSLSLTPTVGTITPRTLTITANPQTKVYGDVDPELTYLVDGLINNDKLDGVLSREAGDTVGQYIIKKGTLTAGPNYTIDFIHKKLTITPRALTVRAEEQSKVYGDADPEFSVNCEGLVVGESLTGALGREAGEDVGSYAITQGTIAASKNYTLSFVDSKINISPKPLTLTAESKTKEFGSSDDLLTFVVDGLVGEDIINGALTRETGDTVSQYAINQGTITASSNYKLNFVAGVYTVVPKTIVVLADNQTKVYGDADPKLSYTVIGLLNADSCEGALSRQLGDTVGNYIISKGELSAGRNYTIDFTESSLQITPRMLTITAKAQNKVYGDADSLRFASEGLLKGDTIVGALNRMAGDSVGNYVITQGTLTAGNNYAVTFEGNVLSIAAKLITINVDNQTKEYGDSDPKFSVSCSQLVGNDSISGHAERQAGDSVGIYAITQGSLSVSKNYEATFQSGLLEIVPRQLVVTAQAVQKTYGEPDPDFHITVDGLVGKDSLSGSLSRSAGDSVGIYSIMQNTISASNNYVLTFNGNNLTIIKRQLTVTPVDTAITYGDAQPNYRLVYSGFAANESVADLDKQPSVNETNTNAGVYTLQASGGSDNNYEFIYAVGKKTILKHPLTIRVVDTTIAQQQAIPNFRLVYTGLVSGDNVSVIKPTPEITCDATSNSEPGTYSVQITNKPVADNYEITTVKGSLSITKVVALTEFETRAAAYPNPTKGHITLSSNSLHTVFYTIHTIDGVKVLNGQFVETTQLDLSEFPAGMYECQLQSGETSSVLQIVLQ